MPQVIENAIKALSEFEAELERIRFQVSEAKKRLVNTAAEEGEVAKKEALASAQSISDERVRAAMQEAQREAESITRKGEDSLKRLKATISKRKNEAIELAVRRLLGG